MINLLFADDHILIREGLKKILEPCQDITVVHECVNGNQVLEYVRENTIDVLVIDLSMPEKSGLEVIKILKVEKPELPILVLSIHLESQYAVRILRAGASGYITKEKASEELISAIRAVASGKRYISSSLGEQLYFELNDSEGQPLYKSLSDREFEVFLMIVNGKSLQGISEELNVSCKTISTYKHRVYEKLHVNSEALLTRYALEMKLIE
jgi:two-component system invasion response regulator UvrY